MDNEQIARLTRRVYVLEQQLDELQRAVGTTPATPKPRLAAAPPSTPGRRRPSPAPRPAVAAPREEADVLGAWFARIGAVVLLIGAGFAFKFAVDRGVIGPTARVVLGVIAGFALVGAGEWSVRRGWRVWAQAVAGAGVALMYVSILAAVQLYDLIDPPFGFACLVAITILCTYAAMRHDSLVLGLLALGGGYLNAVILGTEQPRPLGVFAYLLALELGVLALAFLRRWRALDTLVLAGTIIVVAQTAADATFGAALAFATGYLVVFVALPVLRARRAPSSQADILRIAIATLAYYFYVAALLADRSLVADGRTLADKDGALALAMAVALVGLGFALRARDDLLSLGAFGLGMLFGVIFVPVQFDGAAIPAGWAIEAALLFWAGGFAPLRRLRDVGAGVLLLSLVALIQATAASPPDRLLVSKPSAGFVVEIACLGVIAWFLHRDPAPFPKESAAVAALLALTVGLAWISIEVAEELERAAATPQAIQFALTAVWGSFATALLAVGVRFRRRWIRMAAVSLFAVVVAKLGVVDLWTLSTSYRFIAFAGLGAVLLACSLAFYRFREYLTGNVTSI